MFAAKFWPIRFYMRRYFPAGTPMEPPGDGVPRRFSHVRID